MTKTTARTNIFISEDARALLGALGAAVTGRPSMAAGLAELVARVTEGISTHPTQPGKPATTPYRGAWTSAEGENEETEFAYPSRAEATAAAVLLRYEEARARALAAQAENPDTAARRVWCCYSGTAGIVLSDRDNPQHTANGRYLGDFMGTWAEAQAWALDQDDRIQSEQEQNYNAMIGESLRSRA